MTGAPAGSWAARHPVALLVVGSLVIAWAGILVRLADASVASSATYRCLYSVPALLALALVLRQRARRSGQVSGIAGSLDPRARTAAVIAGIGSAGRLLCWHAAIAAVGAGMATVIHDVQVVLVPLAAWFLFAERPTRRQLCALPVVLVGCLLIAGIADVRGSYGEDPARGVVLGLAAAVMYTVFQLGLKVSVVRSGAAVSTLLIASTCSALLTGAWGVATGTLQGPSWPAHGWLLALALGVQVVGWLLITWSMLRVGATSVSLVLLLQPLGTLLLAGVILEERPSLVQWFGVLVVIAGIIVAIGTDAPADPTNGQDDGAAAGSSPADRDVLLPR